MLFKANHHCGNMAISIQLLSLCKSITGVERDRVLTYKKQVKKYYLSSMCYYIDPSLVSYSSLSIFSRCFSCIPFKNLSEELKIHVTYFITDINDLFISLL